MRQARRPRSDAPGRLDGRRALAFLPTPATLVPVDDVRTNELPYWVGLHRISRLGAARFALLEAAFDSMEEAWLAGAEELVAAGLDTRTAEEVVRRRPEIDVRAECERLTEAGVRALHRPHPAYPARLREIDDAPPVIYIRGSWEPQDEWSVSVVGTRRATAYGREAADELARGLAVHGVTVVSGLARGVDTIAHRAALDAGGRTVAVLANGLDTIYPPENRGLAAEIAERGALITDYPLGTKPRAEFFPRRNRIMSGLSLGTLIVEGDVKSGAMITARLAGEQNREVFAVPGSIFSPQSRGPLSLLRDGATPVTGVEDVLEALNLTMIGAQMDFGRAAPATTPAEQSLMDELTREPRHIDEVAREAGLAAAEVSATLALLELKGLVRDVGGMHYVRVRELPAQYDPVTGAEPAAEQAEESESR
ncbi:MAG: DNA-protecting protein DprA [Chloroflexi bacterium]|nr:DNA-protecting protein DprA [Chloroflexota bacterium]